jgi:hypothetical protein
VTLALPRQVIGVTNLMSVVLLIGPHVLRKVQVRDALPLTLANVRKSNGDAQLTAVPSKEPQRRVSRPAAGSAAGSAAVSTA